MPGDLTIDNEREAVGQVGGGEHLARVDERETTATLTPPAASSSRGAKGQGNGPRPSSRGVRLNRAFLALPRPRTVSAPGSSAGSPSGSSIPREASVARTPSYRGLPST